MNNKKEQLNILYCCDMNYAMPMTVSITSMFENNYQHEVHIYVLYSELTEDQKDKLINLAYAYDQEIHLIKVADHYFEDAPTLRWSKETYYRLLISELLPTNLEKILYLDCDIIVHKSLIDIFKIEKKDYILVMFSEEKHSELSIQRLNLKSNKYFQAGVILFDSQQTKDILSYESSLEIIEKLGDKLQVVDQDVINVMFDGKIGLLDRKFNNCEITNFNGKNLNRFLNKIDKQELQDTVIFHYATGKPWNNLYSGSCEDIWYHYLRLSPYGYLYKQKFNTLKYKLLRLGIIKILLFEYIHITPIINKVFKKIFSQHKYQKLRQFYRKNIK